MSKVVKVLQVANFDFSAFNEDFFHRMPDEFKYEPMTSVEVESSFSIYRNVCQDNQRSFKLEIFRMAMAIYCNAE